MKSKFKYKILAFLVLAVGWNVQCHAQLSKTDSLYQVIENYDSLLYDAAFNLRSGKELKKYLSDNLEFYHDKGGLIAQSADDLILGFGRNWKKMKEGNKKFQRREGIKENIEIYPLDGFGAMVMGEHKFYEYENEGKEVYDSKSKYITIWKQQENGHWVASRIISYNHQLIMGDH